MSTEELITYNGKQYKFRDLPPEVQEILKDDNNNGIPDRLEPKVNATTQPNSMIQPGQKSQLQTQTPRQKAPVKVDSVSSSLVKKYLSTSTFYLALTIFGGVIIFALIFLLGFSTS